MLNAKTICTTPGSYAQVVPVGLTVRLQYDQNGLLEKMICGLSNSYEEGEFLDKASFDILQKYVPVTIPLKGGTTWIHGVFYSHATLPVVSGELDNLAEYYLANLAQINDFVFYAGSVDSLCASFRSYPSVRNWLSIAKFTILPGFAVPYGTNQKAFIDMLKSACSKFRYPYICGFLVYEDGKIVYRAAGLHQSIVKSVSRQMDENGYVTGSVKMEDRTETLLWSSVVRHQIQAGKILLFSSDAPEDVLDVRRSDNKVREAVPNTLKCPFCNKVYSVPVSGPVVCDNPSCLSHSYPYITHILRALNLPEISYNDYIEAVNSRDMISATDVLLLPQYKDTKIDASLGQAVHAATPVDVCADESFFDRLDRSVNGAVDSLMYYLGTPTKVLTELSLTGVPAQRFVEWVASPENLLTVRTILSAVNLVEKKAAFQGAPMFANKTFVITGKFLHGDYATIRSIIESYSGSVEADLRSKHVDLVITGDTMDGISGEILKDAKALNVPVVDETSFFRHYEIDEDLANLL